MGRDAADPLTRFSIPHINTSIRKCSSWITGPNALSLGMIMNSASVDRRDPYAAAIASAASQHSTMDAALQHLAAHFAASRW
jgi:hypothetical protein